MRIGKTELAYFVIFFVALLAIFEFNVLAGGTITSPQNLAYDLASPPNSPQDWNVQNWTSVRYRAVFRLIVRGTWSAFFDPGDAWGFYAVFVLNSFFFFYCAIIALYFLLRLIDFDRRTSFLGCLLFLALPPVLLAYKYPVFTREDPLAYLLITLGLIATIKSKPFWVCLISIIAALTRETTLILPLAYLLGAEESVRKRVIVFVPPILAYLGLHLLWGNESHDLLESLQNTLRTPWETVAFLFCVFGALWLPYGVNLLNHWRLNDAENFGWRLLTCTGPIILVAVMGSTLLIARAREARIAFVLFPWVVPFALDWLRRSSRQLRALASQLSFWVFAIAVLVILSSITLWFRYGYPDLMQAVLADFKNGYWLSVGVVNLSVTITLLGVIVRTKTSRVYQ
jgi:hypothetical protein